MQVDLMPLADTLLKHITPDQAGMRDHREEPQKLLSRELLVPFGIAPDLQQGGIIEAQDHARLLDKELCIALDLLPWQHWPQQIAPGGIADACGEIANQQD